jgi:adenosylcobinamide-phosphate synthase
MPGPVSVLHPVNPLARGLALGFAADLVLGDPARGHPVAAFGKVAEALERRVWRPRRAAGAAFVAALVLPASLLAAATRRLPAALRAPAIAALAWSALGGRSLGREALRIAELAADDDLEPARRALPALVGRDPRDLDRDGVCRAVVESVAENTADAVLGPLVWGAVAGPAGIVAYRAANTLDAMVGHRSPRHERFGWAAARLDDVLGWPGARVGALLGVALAPAAGGSPSRAWETLRRDGHRHPSPNAGRMEAVFAGALGVGLGGANRYGGRVEDRPRLGDGRPPGPGDVVRAVRLSRAVGAGGAVAAIAAAAWRPW